MEHPNCNNNVDDVTTAVMDVTVHKERLLG